MTSHERLLPAELLHPAVYLKEFQVNFPNIRTPTSILHLTDTHFGKWGVHSWLRVKEQQRLVEKIAKIAASNSSALLFTGDVGSGVGWLPWNSPPDKNMLKEIIDPLKGLSIPKYATFGNHDFYIDNSIPAEILDDCGFIILSPTANQPVMAQLTEDISIWGIPDSMEQQKQYQEICGNIKKFYRGIHPDILPVILAHNPDTFHHLPADLRYLGLSGHTHGAAYTQRHLRQFAIDLLQQASPELDLMQGIFINKASSIAYVSNGAGRHVGTPFSDVPMEVTLVRISGSDSTMTTN